MKPKINDLQNKKFSIVRNSALFILYILLTCCSKPNEANENPNKVAYYNFKATDIERILSYTQNQQIVFKNQFGEERVFKITNVSKFYKNSYTVGMGFFSSYAAKYFDYDKKEIYFNNSNCGGFEINFIRWPNNTELAESNIKYEYPSSFSGYIDYFPYWNGTPALSNHSSTIYIDYTINKISMTINSTIFNDVIKIVSNNSISLPSGNPNCPKNVNIIYYDQKKGIIGFDDLDNKNWRLQ